NAPNSTDNSVAAAKAESAPAPKRQTYSFFPIEHPASSTAISTAGRMMAAFTTRGEGQHGDQQMISGNRAILNASDSGRALRVFEGTGGIVEYRGQFKLDSSRPFYRDDAPETGGGPVRSVIVFRLRPIDGPPQDAFGLPAI